MLTISPDRMRIRTGHRAHMPRSSEAPPIAHVIYRDPSDPWSPQRSSAHTDSLHSTHRLGRLEPRTAQGTRQSAVRVRAQQRGQAHRRHVRWNLRCPKCCAAAHLIQTCESRAGVSGMSVARGRRPPSSGGCTYLRGIKVVRWPRIQRSEVALQPTGGHASGGASVRRRSRVAHHLAATPLKMRLVTCNNCCVLT